MSAETFPDFVRSLPQVDLKIEGLTGWILKGETGVVMFMAADRDVLVPRHHHGTQWGVVLAGSMELTVDGETHTYARGDTHHVPRGVDHEARIHKGWRGVYYFEAGPPGVREES